MEISEEQKELVDKIARCNESILMFAKKWLDRGVHVVIEEDCKYYDSKHFCNNVFMDNMTLELALYFVQKSYSGGNFGMMKFWNNARESFMKRLVALNEAEAAQ